MKKTILLSILLCSFTIYRCFWEKDKNTMALDDDVLLDKIEFSGYTWLVRNTEQLEGPGKNFFSASNKNVWVDSEGKLHLKITKRSNGRWYCSEVYTEKTFEYGKYIFYIESPHIETLDPNVVLGLFTWDNDAFQNMANTEIDIEFAKWGNHFDLNTLQYSVQPTNGGKFKERQHRPIIPMTLLGSNSMHIFEWNSNKIYFASFRGYNSDAPLSKIDEWFFDNTNLPRQALNEDTGQLSNPVVIPNPTPGTKVHINLWLCDSDNDKVGNPPTNKEETEVIIEAFEYIPYAKNTEGLVAYYPFNGNSNDESGNGNHGTINGTTLTTDRFGNSDKAYNFDGVDDLINCGHNSSLQLTNAITISAWFNSTSSDVLGRYIIGKCDRNSPSYEYLICFDYSVGVSGYGLKSCIGGLNYDEVGTNFRPDANTWYHVVVTWQYPGSFKLYLNGALLNSKSSTSSIEPTNQDMVIGCIRPSGEPQMRFFSGKIDDIRIYNRALSDSEIQQLYHEGSW